MSIKDLNGGTPSTAAWSRQATLLLLLIATPSFSSAHAQQATLRIWGLAGSTSEASPVLALLTKLEADFARTHPEIRFEHHLYGQDSALGALSVGAADLAILDRPPSYLELDGYQQAIKGETPFALAFMVGGATGGHSSPLVLVADRNNPVDRISLSQLAMLFQPAAAGAAPPTWGQLGLAGAWKDRTIHLHGPPQESAEAATFSHLVMADSKRWACACDPNDRVPAGKDETALAITTLDAVPANMRVLPLLDLDGIPRYPTPEALRQNRYPLARPVSIYSRRSSDRGPESKVRSFLLYLRTPEAKALIAREGSYLILDDNTQSNSGASPQ